MPQQQVETAAKEAIEKWLEGADIKKIVFVKNKIVNFVI